MKIMEWPKQERPRERLLQQGPASLSDAELLAIFLRTGSKKLNVIDLARYLLHDFHGLRPLLEADFNAFSQYPGLGIAKFCQLKASVELCKRYLQHNLQLENGFTDSEQVKMYLKSLLSHEKREQFLVLFLNNQHQLLAYEVLFHGTINSSEIHPRVVVEKALLHHASSVLFSHNHPSGNIQPSHADKQVTLKLRNALSLIDIKVLDHIIVGQGNCYSFAEKGLL